MADVVIEPPPRAPRLMRLQRTRVLEHYMFSTTAALFVAIVFAGFGRTYYLHGMVAAPLPSVIVHVHGLLMTLWVASAIRLEATLSFLGLGTQPPAPSWGNIIRDGLNNVFGSPWPIVAAGLGITLVVLSFNIIGDSVRDVLDPETNA